MNWLTKTTCLLFLCCPAIAASPFAVEKHYQGTIGSRSKIYLRLITNGSQLSGTYVYDWVGHSIDLKGEKMPGDDFRLQEFVPDKKNKPVLSGVFKGKVSNGTELQGNWSSADGKKILPFHLVQVGVTINHYKEKRAVELVMSLDEGKKQELEVSYPQIAGLSDKVAETRLNNILRKQVFAFDFHPSYRELVEAHEMELDDTQGESPENIHVHGFYETREYAARYNANSLLSFNMDNQNMWGGPYPNVDEEYVVLDTNKGTVLALGDVLKKDNLPQFTQFLCHRLLKNGIDLKRCDDLQKAVSSGNLPCYGLDSGAPEFYVDQYGMGFDLECSPHAVYATGLIRIPYKDLGNFIDPNSPLKIFRGK